MDDTKIEFALYDGRYLVDPYRVGMLESCETIEEARKNRKEYGNDTVIVKTTLKAVGVRRWKVVSSEVVK